MQLSNSKIIIETDETSHITRLSMDSEDGKRIGDNLLLKPSTLLYDNNIMAKDVLFLCCESHTDYIIISIENKSSRELENVSLSLPFDQLYTATVLYPTTLGNKNECLPPWMILAPDYGYALITPSPKNGWSATIIGQRNYVKENAPLCGVASSLRAQEWIKASKVLDYKRGELDLRFTYHHILKPGAKIELKLTVPELLQPEGIDGTTWQQIRRPYMNVWQPNSSWANDALTMVLSNNVLSNPASLSIWYYSAPMHFWHKILPGIDMIILLKHSLDFYIKHYCLPTGQMIAFGRHDTYISTNASFLIAVWDYFKISGDKLWIEDNINKLSNLANFLIRRDIDDDGIIESYGSGNKGMLRDPDRADVW